MIISERTCSREVGEYKICFTDVHEPKVYFVDGSMNPLDTVATLTRGYSGVYDINEPTQEDIQKAIDDLNKTKLQTPFEMEYFVFLIKDVTRSFTHQLVRTRLASYVQESMRFLGAKDVYKVYIPNRISSDPLPIMSDLYFNSASQSIRAYEFYLSHGISSEDARDILPHGILTSVFLGIQLSSLRKMYEQRMCCQAQPGQWQVVMREIKEELIRAYGSKASDLLSAPFERGDSCNYRASFDRPCKWTKESNDNPSL
jgi:thymidylate synthase (FAD)